MIEPRTGGSGREEKVAEAAAGIVIYVRQMMSKQANQAVGMEPESKQASESGGGGKQGVLCYGWFRLREGLREDTYMYRLYFAFGSVLAGGRRWGEGGGESESFEPASEFCNVFIPRASMRFSLTMYKCGSDNYVEHL